VLTEAMFPPPPEVVPWKIGKCIPRDYATMDKKKEQQNVVIPEVLVPGFNRYLDMLPNPRTKVLLPQLPGQGRESTYVNANYIRGPDKNPQAFIGAMAPMTDKEGQFWRMVWQEKIGDIIMVTGLIEQGKVKCPPYWPQSSTGKGSVMKYDGLTVTNLGCQVMVRCPFFDRILHSRMPLDPTHVRLK